LALEKPGPWLSEDLRHDLDWALREIKTQLRWGKSKQLARIQEWINRMARVRGFYKNLLNDKNGAEERMQFRAKHEASLKFKKFVYSTNAKVYKFLSQQPQITKALFVFDQILLHEAGLATTQNWRDRKDVAQVIINSRKDSELSNLGKGEGFFSYLREAGVDSALVNQSSWLNVMFKELLFSFTFYYIPAVKHIFCPDFYKTAKATRAKNIYLAVKQLREPKGDFKALRYFSRWSMIGRIDMSKVWEGFRAIPERVGVRYKVQKKLQKAFQNKRYKYFYSFQDPVGAQYHVVSIRNKKYTVSDNPKKPIFYAYRDRHKFRFFEPK
jgi:hypothetical protein